MPKLLKLTLLKHFFLTYILSLVVVAASFGQTTKGIKKIVIDAGHGGHDPGCHGAVANEKDIALSIALKLGKYIEKNLPDVEVIYTRKTDVFVELHKRAKIANDAKADLFICIHGNAGPAAAFGAETYVMGLHKDKANLEISKVTNRENSSILLEDNYSDKYDGFDPNSPETHIILSLFQNLYLEQSTKFANYIQTEFREKAKRHDRGVRQAGFLVLYRTTMASVLIETGFLTNKNEEKYLNSEQGQDYLASAIYRAFKKYKYGVEGKVASVKNETIKPEVKTPNVENETPDSEKVESTDVKTEVEKTKPIKLNENGLVFRIQFAVSSKNTPVSDAKFSKLDNVYKYQVGKLYKYTAGQFSSFAEAGKYQAKVRKLGYEKAFLVAFKNGERVSVTPDMKKLK